MIHLRIIFVGVYWRVMDSSLWRAWHDESFLPLAAADAGSKPAFDL